MGNRRNFIKNGLMLCLGAGGALAGCASLTFPSTGNKRWGMIIDGARCSGCQSCMVACKLQSNTGPGNFNTTITEIETGTYPDAGLRFEPSLCRHCTDAPCVSTCATGAAFVHESGLVMTDWNRCDGNGACIDACPYEARFSDTRFDNKTDKCDLCLHRISSGLVPACVENCSSGARMFGRLDKPEGEFARYLKSIPASQRENGAAFIISADEKRDRV